MKKLFLLASFLFAVLTIQAQGLVTPQPSPSSKISQKIGLAEVSVAYSRPSAKNRVIFGDIVPFGKIWRTGANSPTKIKFDEEVIFEGNKVPAGEYSLMSFPDKDQWTIVINKDTKGNGAFTYQESDDVAKFTVKSVKLTQHVESFSISFSDLGFNSATLELAWEKTSVRIKLENKVDEKIAKQIEKLTAPTRDASLFFNIAAYYYETNQKNDEALAFVTKATDMAPRYWTLQMKAKIQARANDFAGALATIDKSTELATKDKDDAYVNANAKLKAEWAKKKK
ncbi:MAG: DUF2911 domain-containing protein [Bacteroidetes bacterium]|nr:MAG: DUF2911 domain-containing protein [Bacteroidota bacterium]TAG93634.1 MAG: DUF2911 domain-containing protein [Bacteroidota bacterium]